jgi:hypothetical protein
MSKYQLPLLIIEYTVFFRGNGVVHYCTLVCIIAWIISPYLTLTIATVFVSACSGCVSALFN